MASQQKENETTQQIATNKTDIACEFTLLNKFCYFRKTKKRFYELRMQRSGKVHVYHAQGLGSTRRITREKDCAIYFIISNYQWACKHRLLSQSTNAKNHSTSLAPSNGKGETPKKVLRLISKFKVPVFHQQNSTPLRQEDFSLSRHQGHTGHLSRQVTRHTVTPFSVTSPGDTK